MQTRSAQLITGLSSLALASVTPAYAILAPRLPYSGGVTTNSNPTPASRSDSERPFLVENAAAMKRMMAAMEPRPTGDVDRDFVAMMIPHHKGAIDMAVAVLRHGRNAQIRRIANEMIVTQTQEIAAMNLALGNPAAPAATSPGPWPNGIAKHRATHPGHDGGSE